VGHSHPKVVAVIKDQAEKFTHTCFRVNSEAVAAVAAEPVQGEGGFIAPPWQKQFDVIGEIRGLGVMLGPELVNGPDKQPAADAAKQLAADCLENGLITLTCGSYGNIVRILAPLVITDQQLDKGPAILEQGLAQIPG
jgi:4-aminobutyrate aminotransferase-like enzyme